ncbi:MAG: YdbL family protein [Pseudomonadota bacterium]|nr:YdbL family protein [Pseudomonadota bacterium]
MRKPLPMFSFRKLFVITAAVAALGVAAGAAFAQTAGQKAMIDAAKAQGAVGEQADGYLGFRQPSSDPALTQAVTVTNSARREAYANTARTAGTTTEVAAARAFVTIVQPRISSGEWYRNAQGQWVQR